MARIPQDKLLDKLSEKKENFNVRVTTFIHGSVKNDFLNDCIKRDFNEAKMASQIIDTYYSVLQANPNIAQMEMLEVKKYIIEKIKISL